MKEPLHSSVRCGDGTKEHSCGVKFRLILQRAMFPRSGSHCVAVDDGGLQCVGMQSYLHLEGRDAAVAWSSQPAGGRLREVVGLERPSDCRGNCLLRAVCRWIRLVCRSLPVTDPTVLFWSRCLELQLLKLNLILNNW